NVRRLIDYIITEPEVDDLKRGHKFPFVASELLNCDVGKINDYFTTTEAEFVIKDRKVSNISQADSDMILISEDHFHFDEKSPKNTAQTFTINLEKSE